MSSHRLQLVDRFLTGSLVPFGKGVFRIGDQAVAIGHGLVSLGLFRGGRFAFLLRLHVARRTQREIDRIKE